MDLVTISAVLLRVAKQAFGPLLRGHSGVTGTPVFRVRHGHTVTADTEIGLVASGADRGSLVHYGQAMGLDPIPGVRHLHRMALQAVVRLVALPAGFQLRHRQLAVVLLPFGRMRHLDAVACPVSYT